MKLLEQLCLAYGPSGAEGCVREQIKNEIAPYADEISVDALGNLIAHKKGSGKKIMLAAHMDEIGLMVTYIDDKGFLRFAQVGWLPPVFTINRQVRFENGVKGVVAYEKEMEKELKQAKLFIDIGAKSREEAESMVKVGDCAVMVSEFTEMNDRVTCKAMDNRAGCYALIKAAQEINSSNDIYYVFTTQEEIGLRGAKTAAFAIEPDLALSVDTTMTGDTPESDKMAVTLGGGVAIKVMDGSIITNSYLRKRMIELAQGIPYQLEVLIDGGTDGGTIHTSRGGVMTGGISIPTRYIHSITETVDKNDLKNAITLIKRFCEEV
ncbi:MAG: M42 family metallopeptidase [Bacillota bacterium]|nr:M42 family metallopeptidase [Bacillota bacterium]